MKSDLAARISSASGDAGALLALAIELAQENAQLRAQADTLQALEVRRKADQAARKQRSRHGKSRDVTGQGVTGRDDGSSTPSPLPSSSFPTPHITPSFPPSPSEPPPTRTIRVIPPPNPDVAVVISHFRTVHPKRKPGPKDERAVVKALGFGYSAAELCEAIDGNAADDWHQKKRKHDLPYVLRDNGVIDNFRATSAATAIRVVDGWFAESA